MKKTALHVILVCALLWASSVSAMPISASLAYQFLDQRADNSSGIAPGVFQQFGANCVIPTGLGLPCNPQNPGAPFGTTGVATQAGIARTLGFVASDLTSNHFASANPPAAVPDGSWLLTFSNEGNQATVSTPDLAGALPLGFVNSMTISGSGPTPVFNWTLPTPSPGASIDAVRVVIRDTTNFATDNIAPIIFVRTLPPGGFTSFSVPSAQVSLQQDNKYSLEIQLADTRNDLAGGGFPNTLSQSRSFFDFTLLPPGTVANVFLPTLIQGATPFYSFKQGNPVVPGTLYFYDPLVAIGYDYQIGIGDPNIAAVLLPTGIGDNLFDLWLWNGLTYADSGIDLIGGVKHNFGGAGVDRFRILGIEPAAGLDPANVTAFVTGLEFAANGSFTGTMTPLTQQVPEPRSLAFMAVGVVGILLARYVRATQRTPARPIARAQRAPGRR